MKWWIKCMLWALLGFFSLEMLYAQEPEQLLSELKKEQAKLLEKGELASIQQAALQNKLAKYYFKQKRYEQALAYFELELKSYLRVKSSDDYTTAKIKAYYNAASLNRLLGNYPKAYHQAQKAAFWAVQHFGPKHIETSDAYKLLADIAMFWKRPDLQSLYTEKAVEAFVAASQDSSAWVDLILLQAVYYINTGAYEQGANLLNKAKEFELKHPLNSSIRAKLYTNLGVLCEYQDYNTEALNYYRKALEIRLAGGEKQISIAWLWDNMGVVFNKMKDYEKALEYFEKSYQLTKELLGEDHVRTIELLAHKATALSEPDPKQAVLLFEKQIQALQSKFGLFCQEQILALQKLGSMAYKKADFQKAIYYAEQVEAILLKHPKSSQFARARHFYNQARYYDRAAQKEKALAYYQKAWNYNQIGEGTQHYDCFSPSLSLKIVSALIAIPALYRDATKLIEREMLMLQNKYKEQQFQADQKHLVSLAKGFYEKALNYFYELPALDEKQKSLVWKCFVSSKAFSLAEALSFKDFCREIGLSEEEQRALQRGITNERLYQKQWLEAEASGDSLEIERQFRWLQQARRARVAKFKALSERFPQLSSFVEGPEIATLAQLMSVLEETEAYISYFEGEQAVFRLTIGKAIWSFERITKSSLKDLQLLLDELNASETDFMKVAAFVDLIEPISKSLMPNKDLLEEVDRLIISPDGQLHYLPFEILLVEEAGNRNNFSELPYCLKSFAVVYQFQPIISPKIQMESGVARLLAYSPDYQAGLKLPAAQMEIAMLEQKFQVDAYTPKQIDKNQFRENLASYHFVHLAMHAVAPDSGQAYLLFPKGEKMKVEELAGLNMQTCQLLVLSACQTALGKYEKGEGVMSLGRAFLENAVQAELISLWSLPDQATRQLMTNFYNYLSKGLAKDEALKKAKLDFLQTAGRLQAQPTYWAGLILWGNPYPIDLPKTSFSKKCYYLWGGILALMILFLSAWALFSKTIKR